MRYLTEDRIRRWLEWAREWLIVIIYVTVFIYLGIYVIEKVFSPNQYDMKITVVSP